MATVTGNTLVLKPSERDPGAAMIIAELCERAGSWSKILFNQLNMISFLGLPPGVLNVVHGTVPMVNAICDHPTIKAISFVGGDRAGKHIYERLVHHVIAQSLTSKLIRYPHVEVRRTAKGSRYILFVVK